MPTLLQVAGGKDAESWKTFFGTLEGEPTWVIADLDPALARAVRETWPSAILYHSQHHLEALMRGRAIADGVPERVRLDEPVKLRRPLAWTGSDERRFGDHPLFAAMAVAQRGPAEWGAFKALVSEHVAPDRLELRSWIATHELLIERQWRIARVHDQIPLSTGALEGKLAEWLAPIRRRAGRWQNARRLNLVLGLITLAGRGEAREARYATLVRRQFEACGNASHRPADNTLPLEIYRGRTRRLSWWRTWQDRAVASLPRLVFESDRRWRRRAADEHLARARERLARTYAAETGLREQLGIALPPAGRPKNPVARPAMSLKGRFLREFEDLLAEWDWDFNGDLDPLTLRAGSHVTVAWRCLLNPDHVWETRLSDRLYRRSFCPYHMGVKVHPSESLAAYFPWLAKEWHPTKNALRPDQVARASARELVWRCELGHEWRAVVYARTLSRSGCPQCFRLSQPVKSRTAIERRRRAADARADAQIASLLPRPGPEPGELPLDELSL